MRTSDQTRGIASMVDLRKLARTMLPASTTLRDLISSEPDYPPTGES